MLGSGNSLLVRSFGTAAADGRLGFRAVNNCMINSESVVAGCKTSLTVTYSSACKNAEVPYQALLELASMATSD